LEKLEKILFLVEICNIFIFQRNLLRNVKISIFGQAAKYWCFMKKSTSKSFTLKYFGGTGRTGIWPQFQGRFYFMIRFSRCCGRSWHRNWWNWNKGNALENLGNNKNFGPKSEFWSKESIMVKNQNFMKKNQIFGQTSKYIFFIIETLLLNIFLMFKYF